MLLLIDNSIYLNGNHVCLCYLNKELLLHVLQDGLRCQLNTLLTLLQLFKDNIYLSALQSYIDQIRHTSLSKPYTLKFLNYVILVLFFSARVLFYIEGSLIKEFYLEDELCMNIAGLIISNVSNLILNYYAKKLKFFKK